MIQIVVWVLLVLNGLGTYRVTRLFTTDKLLERPRVRVALALADADHEGTLVARRGARLAYPRWALAYLLTCPWCMSGWVSAALVLAETRVLHHVPLPWLLWLASWAISPNIQAREPEDK